MNTSLLDIVKQIVADQGDAILSDPKRVTAFFSDLARDVPKPPKYAFVKCLEHKFAQILKNASAADREDCKQQLAQTLNRKEGLDLALCSETLDLLAALLFGEEKKKEKKKDLCNNCGKELEEVWKTCPYCEQPKSTALKKPAPSPAKKKPVLEKDILQSSAEIWICGRCKSRNSFANDFCKNCDKEFNPPLWRNE